MEYKFDSHSILIIICLKSIWTRSSLPLEILYCTYFSFNLPFYSTSPIEFYPDIFLCLLYAVVKMYVYVKNNLKTLLWLQALNVKNISRLPGLYDSVDWALACEPKGHKFDSQSGHIPALQARSPVGDAQEATTHWCFSPSLSPTLPLSLKMNK